MNNNFLWAFSANTAMGSFSWATDVSCSEWGAIIFPVFDSNGEHSFCAGGLSPWDPQDPNSKPEFFDLGRFETLKDAQLACEQWLSGKAISK
jgi:hypothetical protein